MLRPIALAILVLISPAAEAAERKLTGAEITAALSDHTLAGEQDGKAWQQIFQAQGLTIYSQGTANSNGRWRVQGDQYCSQWPPNDSWACYYVLGEGDTITFVSSSGTRYPGKIVN